MKSKFAFHQCHLSFSQCISIPKLISRALKSCIAGVLSTIHGIPPEILMHVRGVSRPTEGEHVACIVMCPCVSKQRPSAASPLTLDELSNSGFTWLSTVIYQPEAVRDRQPGLQKRGLIVNCYVHFEFHRFRGGDQHSVGGHAIVEGLTMAHVQIKPPLSTAFHFNLHLEERCRRGRNRRVSW